MAYASPEFRNIEQRESDLKVWLKNNAPECFSEQKHCTEGAQERIYWHYGYLMALRDVMRLMCGETTPDRQGNYGTHREALRGVRGSLVD